MDIFRDMLHNMFGQLRPKTKQSVAQSEPVQAEEMWDIPTVPMGDGLGRIMTLEELLSEDLRLPLLVAPLEHRVSSHRPRGYADLCLDPTDSPSAPPLDITDADREAFRKMFLEK